MSNSVPTGFEYKRGYSAWVGDVVKITADRTVDDVFIPINYREGKRNWVVTAVSGDRVYLGEYRAFGLHYPYYPPIVVSNENLIPVEKVCRHANEIILPKVRSTCLSEGKTQGKKCAHCGITLVEQEIIPIRDHMFEYDYDKNTRTCMLCKYVESIPERSVVIKRQDIRSLVNLFESMVEDKVVLTDQTSKSYAASDSDLLDAALTHNFTEEQYHLNYQLYSPVEKSGATSKLDLTKYKYPLIVWFSDDTNNTPFRQLVEASDGSVEEEFNTDLLDGYAAFIFVPILKGSDWRTCKSEFFSTLNHIICSYNIDERKIILMGSGLNSIGSQFMMYQDPDRFSYQVIIDGHDSFVDVVSLRDRSDTTMLVRTTPGRSTYHDVLESIYGDSVEPSTESSETTSGDEEQEQNTEFRTLEDALMTVFDSSNLSNMLNKLSPAAEREHLENEGVSPDQGILQEKLQVTILEGVLPLRKNPSISSESVGMQEILYGHTVLIDKIEYNQNYIWGRLDEEYWLPIAGTDYTTQVSECWIPLELTTMMDNTTADYSSYIVPCSYEAILRTVKEYSRNNTMYSHNGVDLKAPWGTPVYATSEGTVVSIADSIDFGQSITIEHTDGKSAFYAHIIPTDTLTVGQSVAAGQFIGKVGGTNGTVTPEPHLHFAIKDSDGQWIHPTSFNGGVTFYR